MWTKIFNQNLTFICAQIFYFHMVMVTLDQYFQRKDSLPNPNGELLLNITLGIIAAMKSWVCCWNLAILAKQPLRSVK